MQLILKVFPQCNDQIARSKTGRYVAHMTIASLTSEEAACAEIERIKESWIPLSFELKELYLLFRIGGDPFEVKEIVHLGNDYTVPHFGLGSPGSLGSLTEDLAIGRTVVVCGIPRGLNDSRLLSAFKKKNFPTITRAEILLNPDGTARNLGVVEFATKEDTQAALYMPMPSDMFGTGYQTYLKHLPLMVFPGTVGDCCSLNAVRKQLESKR